MQGSMLPTPRLCVKGDPEYGNYRIFKTVPGKNDSWVFIKALGTDPEFIERFTNFAFDEVVNQDALDGRTRFMAILAALLGCQGLDMFKVMVPAALRFGVTPVEIKEIVYQSVAYLGIGRVYPFLDAVNACLISEGVLLPLEGQAETTMENRLEAGGPGTGGHFW